MAVKKKTNTTTTIMPMDEELDMFLTMEEEPNEGLEEKDASSNDIPDDEKLYYAEISKFKLLDAAQELELGRRIAMGDAEAKKALMDSNYRLVVSIAKTYAVPVGMARLDLIQEGNMGLINAVERYDYTKGYRFSTYATPWIKKHINMCLDKYGRTIYLPKNVREEIAAVNKSRENLEQHLERTPTEMEVAADTGLSLKKLRELKIVGQTPVSLYAPVKNKKGEDTIIEDFVPDPAMDPEEYVVNNSYKEDLRKDMKTVIDMLPEVEANIVRLSFGINDGIERDEDEVAMMLDLRPRRVLQLKEDAFKRMERSSASVSILKDYLSDKQRDRLGLAA